MENDNLSKEQEQRGGIERKLEYIVPVYLDEAYRSVFPEGIPEFLRQEDNCVNITVPCSFMNKEWYPGKPDWAELFTAQGNVGLVDALQEKGLYRMPFPDACENPKNAAIVIASALKNDALQVDERNSLISCLHEHIPVQDRWALDRKEKSFQEFLNERTVEDIAGIVEERFQKYPDDLRDMKESGRLVPLMTNIYSSGQSALHASVLLEDLGMTTKDGGFLETCLIIPENKIGLTPVLFHINSFENFEFNLEGKDGGGITIQNREGSPALVCSSSDKKYVVLPEAKWEESLDYAFLKEAMDRRAFIKDVFESVERMKALSIASKKDEGAYIVHKLFRKWLKDNPMNKEDLYDRRALSKAYDAVSLELAKMPLVQKNAKKFQDILEKYSPYIPSEGESPKKLHDWIRKELETKKSKEHVR